MRNWTPPENWVPHKLAAVPDGRGGKQLVKIPGFDPKKNPRLRAAFGGALNVVRDVIPSLDKHSLVCATPDCPATMRYVKKSKGNGNDYTTDAHMPSNRLADHISGCIFKNEPILEAGAHIGLQEAIERGMAILINLNGEFGYEGDAPKTSFRGGEPKTPFERWRDFMDANGGYLPHPVRNFEQAATELEKITDMGGNAVINYKGMIVSGDDIDMTVSQRAADPRKDKHLHNLLVDLLQDCDDNNYTRYGLEAPRMRDVDLGRATYDHTSHCLVTPPEEIRANGHAYFVRHRLYLSELENTRELTARRIIRDLIHRRGRRLTMLATPRMDPDHAMAACDIMKTGKPLIGRDPIVFLDWIVNDMEGQFRTAPKPKTPEQTDFISAAYRPEEDRGLQRAASSDGLHIATRTAPKPAPSI